MLILLTQQGDKLSLHLNQKRDCPRKYLVWKTPIQILREDIVAINGTIYF